MGTRSEPAGRERGFQVAARRFPQAEFAIRKLMSRDETFCEICEELADAELALARIPPTPAERAEARRLEWEELIDRLAGEVAAALRASEGWTTRATGASMRGER